MCPRAGVENLEKRNPLTPTEIQSPCDQAVFLAILPTNNNNNNMPI